MRKGITISVTPADRVRLDAIARDRNSPQKHVWRIPASFTRLSALSSGSFTRLTLTLYDLPPVGS
jgi:hypothetical protein